MLQDHRLALEALGGWLERGPGCHVAGFPGMTMELLNGVWVDPDDGDRAVPALRDLLDDLEERGATPYVITLGPASPAVEAEARRLGLSSVELLPAMLVMPGWLREPPETESWSFSLASEPEVAADVLARGFEMSQGRAAAILNGSLLALDVVDVHVAWVGTMATSTATTFTGESAGVYLVATPPEHRGRGYGGAVTAHAVREAFGRGAAFAYLQASAKGFPVYRRVGFEERFRFTVFGRPVAEPSPSSTEPG
jgi:GNAT superfamily N-acetyltransferase